ncbi:hypothetical protein OG339_42870 [Streptosporangium sp. NBC_01495]|uniref:hypothetical protein n=1 Tax=Streptosporangium sp. NBC_01495 TaxID=2903899 RepID=UPI002E30CF12|nr:hypothetical protein [Streptosporangium sp. NBC_01495]
MSDFLEKVASAADATPEVAATILADHGIRESIPSAPAAELRVREVNFSGFKNQNTDQPTDPFNFNWTIPGRVSAIASRGNSAGKTSVIEVIRWLLSGRSSVDNWVFERIQRASVKFLLDEEELAVEVDKDGPRLIGNLSLNGRVIRNFNEKSFESVMEQLMLPRLGLERIDTFQKFPRSERGKITSAGWPLLIDALHVRPSELSNVIGGVAQKAGLLLQVYVSPPWFDTLLQARAVVAISRQASTDRARTSQEEERIRGVETERIRTQLQEARNVLANMKEERASAHELRLAMSRAAMLSDAALRRAAEMQAATLDLETVEEIHLTSRRLLRNIIEREVAGTFFRALTPQACPRCTTVIDDERRTHEADEHICSVCNRPATAQASPSARPQAEAEVSETEKARDKAKSVLERIKVEYDAINEERVRLENRIASLADSESLSQRREQEALVARLEGRLEEREETRRLLALTQNGSTPNEEIRVLSAAQDESEVRVKQSSTLFEELNVEILTLGKRFGISGLTSVKLDRRAHLPVVKEGTKYNFGELPDGDKLRLKVAVVIALLRVGRLHGVRRHPGLLFVDSPGAEEVSTGSLVEMVTALTEIAEELGIQVIISTARLDEMITALDSSLIKSPAPGRTTLW